MADILLIDDDAAIRVLVKTYLEQAGHTTHEADNGQVGISMAQDEAPALIILDINMPVMDGTQTIKALQAEPSTKDIPVIALSAVTVPEMRDDMHLLGCSGYVEKPIDFDILMEHTNRLLGI